MERFMMSELEKSKHYYYFLDMVMDCAKIMAKKKCKITNHEILFIGRSGHSLIAALLDSHPNIAIGKGFLFMCVVISSKTFFFLANGFVELLKHEDGVLNGTRLLQDIVARSSDRASHENRVAGYSYTVKGAHNGKFENLRVVGVKKGGNPSSLGTVFVNQQRLLAATDDLKMAARCLGASLRILHIIRNPFDSKRQLFSSNTHTHLTINLSSYSDYGTSFEEKYQFLSTAWREFQRRDCSETIVGRLVESSTESKRCLATRSQRSTVAMATGCIWKSDRQFQTTSHCTAQTSQSIWSSNLENKFCSLPIIFSVFTRTHSRYLQFY
jgi:hypothetical protein